MAVSFPCRRPCLPIYDAGFVLGATISEQLRTFGGRLFRLEEHLARLAHSLEIVGVRPQLSLEQLGEAARELVARNHPLLAAGDDLGLSMFITPGPYRHALGWRYVGAHGRTAHLPVAVFSVGRKVSTRGILSGHGDRAGLCPIVARGYEVPQPHALLSGRPTCPCHATAGTSADGRRARKRLRNVDGEFALIRARHGARFATAREHFAWNHARRDSRAGAGRGNFVHRAARSSPRTWRRPTKCF